MRNKILRISTLLFFLVGIYSCKKNTEVYILNSPNNTQTLEFSLTDEGAPQYSLTSFHKKTIQPSLLGFTFEDMPAMTKGFKIINSEKSNTNETWEQPWGEFKYIKDNHSQLTIHLQEKEGEQRLMDIVFRLFDDGLGFRYFFPEQPNMKEVKIADEVTQFTFSYNNDVWWIPVHSDNSYYESFYTKTPISQTDTINTPATIETKDSLFIALHEANLTDFASMTLVNKGNNQYKSELVPWANGTKVYATVPFSTPWRTIIVGKNAGDIATSTITLNLNEPSKILDESWIEPSKYVGIWWGMHLEKYTWGQSDKHGATTENTKMYIDFAAKNGFNGVLVEGWNEGWDGDWANNGNAFNFTKSYPDFDINAITAYANSKNVKLIGHNETAGAVTNYENQLEDAFMLYEKLGINAVKTGYVNKYLDGKEWHDGQFGVRHYRKVIETAAKHHIMIDNHEPVKGTGLQRTYPNLMAQEGARGQEYNAWSTDGGNTPEYTTIVPFTRMLAGPFDFTPGIFNFDYKTPAGTRVNTTVAKQLALYVIIFSPVQMAADLPENYINRPEFQFIKDVPITWANTKVVSAKIGDYIVTARKDWDSNNWYLGGITNEKERSLPVNLSFLDNGTYEATIYADGEGANYKTNPYPVTIQTKMVTNKETLELHLAKGGGTAIKFKKLN